MSANLVVGPSSTVTIAATAGTATFSNLNGIVTHVFVSPVGSPSAANAALTLTVASKTYTVIAAEAMSTTATKALYSAADDGGVLTVSVATPLNVVFSGATDDDQWTVTVHVLTR